MDKRTITGVAIAVGVFGVALVLLALFTGVRNLEQDVVPAPINPSTAEAEAHPGSLYGRITIDDGRTYEGRLRWGGAEEAFWGDYFDGAKDDNPWGAHVPPERLEERRPSKIFGFETGRGDRRINLDRLFMTRFGDIARIESSGYDLQVILKSGTVFPLARFEADDFADGVRVWDAKAGVVDIDEWLIDSVEFLLTTPLDTAADRLHGTVRTRQGDFTGFVQWNRVKGVGPDQLNGRTDDGGVNLRFDTIRSIARESSESSRVTLLDGREIVLSGTREAGQGNRGMYVDDRRYGRVLISWDAFERVDFSPGGNGPAYDDFPPGSPLIGSVTTLDGNRHTGRLVFDLDESETTETLDAPFEGVNYTIPFGLIASIVPGGKVTLHHGEELQLERRGDLGERNAGMLIFVDIRERAEYVPWTDVEQVDFIRPPAMYPPLGDVYQTGVSGTR